MTNVSSNHISVFIIIPPVEESLIFSLSLIVWCSQGEDGQFCPDYSVCPKTCDVDEMLCDDGYDSNNCRNADCCLPRGRNNIGELCPINCPPKCTEDEYICPGLMESSGCIGSSICVQKKTGLDGLACPEVCPIPCRGGEVSVFGKTNYNGCLIQDSCEGEK